MNIDARLRKALQGQSVVAGISRDFKSRWLGAVLFFFLALTCTLAIYQPYQRGQLQADGVLLVDELQVYDLNGNTTVPLPDRWLNNGLPLVHRQYRLMFDLESINSDDISLLFPSISKNFKITINGSTIPAFGAVGVSPSWNYSRPHILTLPPELLRGGENDLRIDVYAHSVHDGALGAFYLGNSELLYHEFQFEWRLSEGAAYVVFFLALMFAAVLGIYSLKSASEYRWVALACVFAALMTQRWLVVDPWLGPAQHLALTELFVSSFNISAMMFLFRFNETTPTRLFIQRILVMTLWSIELALLLFAPDIDTVYEVTRGTKTVVNILGVLMLISSCQHYIKRLNLFRLVLISCLAVLVAGGIHENLLRYAVWNVGMDYRYQWSVFYLLTASFVYFLMDALRQSEELGGYRGDLEQQVEGYSSLLESSRQRLLETQQWSVLGYSSMQLWRKLKAPLQTIFDSSSYIHNLTPGHEHEARLTSLSYRSMYSAQRCLRTIEEMELLVGEPEVELIELDMERWVPELLRELHKHFRVELRIGVLDSCTVYGDPYLLRDCIERLVDNSDRACETPEQHGIVEVSVWLTADEVVLSVSDNGPGISPTLTARLKEPLHRGEPNGLGVGLCIVKHYAQLMGIDVRSNPLSQGTCIELVFPRLY